MPELIPLTPIDHIFTGVGSYPIEFVFAYAGTIEADRLHSSLRRAALHFPPVDSRLVRTSDHSYALRPGGGLEFEVCESTSSFADEAARYEFLHPVDGIEGEPLTRVKLTQTPEGSVLGVSMCHAVGDGFSYFFFLTAWAGLFNGRRAPHPSHDRGRLIPGPADGDRRITPEQLLARSGIFWDERRRSIDRRRLRWDRFRMTTQQLAELLREARAQSSARLSYNDVISALLWKRYIARWDADEDVMTYASCPVDVRRIMRSFPRSFFGNAVGLATTSLNGRALRTTPLGELGRAIRDAVASVDERFMHTALATLQALRIQEGLSVVEEQHVIKPRSGILVTNLSRLPVRQLTFDAGPPVAYDILTPAQRGAVVLPAEDGVEIRVCHPMDQRT